MEKDSSYYLYVYCNTAIENCHSSIISKGYSPRDADEFSRDTSQWLEVEYQLYVDPEGFYYNFSIDGKPVPDEEIETTGKEIQYKIYKRLDEYLELLDSIRQKREQVKIKSINVEPNQSKDTHIASQTNKQNKPQRKIPKTRMTQIYKGYVQFYEGERSKYLLSLGTNYGADKKALEATIKEIKKKERIDVKPRNLKEAINRRIVRRPARF
ncbi:MAG: hypothetical protein WAV76_10115 [Bacteroidota bacterium]